jgi:hypothetical protein
VKAQVKTGEAREAFRPEPRWPAVLAVLAMAALYMALPERLTLGPGWFVPLVFVVLIVFALAAHRAGQAQIHSITALTLSGAMTVALIWALTALIVSLPGKRQAPTELLRSAAALWTSNVLVFATWYWRLDAGGPSARERRRSHSTGAFLFPQMTLPPESGIAPRNWKPGFADYLFLAFNTSTAFSPTDVPVLSRWAKLLMMIQSMVSLSTIAILAARAINIL